MLMRRLQAVKNMVVSKQFVTLVIAVSIALMAGCRYDMQDQPKYKSYRPINGGIGSRVPVDGTVFRNNLREDKALYTGKTDVVPTEAPQTAVDSRGSTVTTTFPGAIDTFPIAIDEKTVERGEQRFKVFCSMCHGTLGKGDGMIVRRGFSQPPTYHDDRLRNAPVGHFFDVITNGWGKMNGYASQIPVEDRWAIVAYIRALQISQNPNGMKPMSSNSPAANTVKSVTETKSEVKTEMPANKPVTEKAPVKNGGKQ
jgi:mono/diheme cytochrome c family protein